MKPFVAASPFWFVGDEDPASFAMGHERGEGGTWLRRKCVRVKRGERFAARHGVRRKARTRQAPRQQHSCENTFPHPLNRSTPYHWCEESSRFYTSFGVGACSK
jgi:hypothetical protein